MWFFVLKNLIRSLGRVLIQVGLNSGFEIESLSEGSLSFDGNDVIAFELHRIRRVDGGTFQIWSLFIQYKGVIAKAFDVLDHSILSGSVNFLRTSQITTGLCLRIIGARDFNTNKSYPSVSVLIKDSFSRLSG
jgi:hypothetical protein